MQATHQFLTEILNQWHASGGGITGNLRNDFFLSSPQNPQFNDPVNGFLYPHIHILLDNTNCRFVVSCNSQSHGRGSDISPNVINPATGQVSTVQDFINFFLLRLRQCLPAHAYAPAPAPFFSGFGAAAPAAAPAAPAAAPAAPAAAPAAASATNLSPFRPRQVMRPPMRAQAPMQAQAPMRAQAPMQVEDDSMNGGKRRMIKKTKTQRRRCARRRSNGNKSRRTKRSKSN